jgi:uncharacterized protein (DUF305 family)
MKTSFIAALAFVALANPALSQTQPDHQQHHPGGAPAPQTQAQPQTPAQPPAQMPSGQMPMGHMMQMPEQCRAMMQNMPQGCMGMMQQMMGGTMPGAGGAQGHGTQASPMQGASQSEATKAYSAAVEKMHDPMMKGIQDPDADVAFVKGMIPHHQSAIDMAKIVLQHGKDEQARKWANDVIREQEREIGEMQTWLRKHGKL